MTVTGFISTGYDLHRNGVYHRVAAAYLRHIPTLRDRNSEFFAAGGYLLCKGSADIAEAGVSGDYPDIVRHGEGGKGCKSGIVKHQRVGEWSDAAEAVPAGAHGFPAGNSALEDPFTAAFEGQKPRRIHHYRCI